MRWTIRVGDAATTAEFEPATTSAKDGVVFVCAHGAGGSKDDRGLIATSAVLRERGIGVVRFNFLYKEKKSRRPDPMPLLEETVADVVAETRRELRPKVLLIGGRSMGGRAASMLAAKGFDCDGLVLLAYPLHPAGKPEKLRDAHLPSIEVPVICFNGTRDPLMTRDLMERALKGVTTQWEMHWIEGADHSFHVLKSSGRTDAQVLDDIGDSLEQWVRRLPRRR